MRRAEVPALVAGLAAMSIGVRAGDSLLVLRGSAERPYLALDTAGVLRLGLDGLVDSVERKANPATPSVLSFSCTGDTVEAFATLPDPSAFHDPVRVAGPCVFQGFTGRRAPASLDDLSIFGDGASLPWVHLRMGARQVYASLPSLRLRRVAPDSFRFAAPAVVRAPFLEPALDSPLVADASATTFRLVDGGLVRDTAALDSVAGWNWSVVADPTGSRLRIDSRNLSRWRPVWMASLGASRVRIAFDDTYRREPRKAMVLRARSGRSYLVLEIATRFGHGVWTDLWVIGSDTVRTWRIGEQDGESGSDFRSAWNLGPRRDRILLRAPGKPLRTLFRPK